MSERAGFEGGVVGDPRGITISRPSRSGGSWLLERQPPSNTSPRPAPPGAHYYFPT